MAACFVVCSLVVVGAAIAPPRTAGLEATAEMLPPSPEPPVLQDRPKPGRRQPASQRQPASPTLVMPQPSSTPVVFDTHLVPGELPSGTLPERAERQPPSSPTDANQPKVPFNSDLILLRLSSIPPGMEIRVDGRPRGKAPAKLRLTPGVHKFILEQGGSRSVLKAPLSESDHWCFIRKGKKLQRAPCPKTL